jgi:hypothetical protein
MASKRHPWHELSGDADSMPYDVAKWYRLAERDFLMITDHEMVLQMQSGAAGDEWPV